MKKLQNTLYVTSQDSYLALDGENVVILEDETESLGGFLCIIWNELFLLVTGERARLLWEHVQSGMYRCVF